MKTPNERTVTLKLTRHEVCDLLLSTAASAHRSGASHWRTLHDKIKQILKEHDAKMDSEHSEIPFNEVGAGDIDGIPADQADSVSSDDNEHEMGPGEVFHLANGESITFGNPNIPTASFESFFKTMCKMVGADLELPYDVLIKEFNSSYSAAKGALEEAWEAFKMRRVWLVDDFCQPTYETVCKRKDTHQMGRGRADGGKGSVEAERGDR